VTSPTYQVFAVRYARRDACRAQHFLGGDAHDEPMPMDYFLWAAVSAEHTVVVDTGFTAAVAARRGREYLQCPVEGLAAIGINADQVSHVILTHMHYDHIGNLDRFPTANFTVQSSEMAFWTGPYASRGHFRTLIELDDVLGLVQLSLGGRVRMVSGSAQVVPGVQVHEVGGHSPGLQVVSVNTAAGPVVLASDATHFYANIDTDRPFSIVADLADMYRAFDVVRTLAGHNALVIPGHDPEVMRRFPTVASNTEPLAVRIA
jgi:glyoxylase-like metal-dependent hydrolase (beta-lactamase superfamily II)